MEALRAFHPDGKTSMATNDKRGLPDPLVLTFYFLSPRAINRSAHHSSQSVRFLKNRTSC